MCPYTSNPAGSPDNFELSFSLLSGGGQQHPWIKGSVRPLTDTRGRADVRAVTKQSCPRRQRLKNRVDEKIRKKMILGWGRKKKLTLALVKQRFHRQ